MKIRIRKRTIKYWRLKTQDLVFKIWTILFMLGCYNLIVKQFEPTLKYMVSAALITWAVFSLFDGALRLLKSLRKLTTK